MLVFVNNVFISKEDLEYIELVIHDEKTLTNSFKIGTYEECVRFCREKKAQGWYIQSFVNDQFKLNNKDYRVTHISKTDSITPGFKKEDSLLSIYALYWDLASCHAVYLDDEFKYNDGYVGYLSEFSNIKIHRDSMKVTIPVVFNDNIACVRELISQDDIPYHHNFKAAVPAEFISKFYQYGIKELGSITLNNKKFIIVSYLRNLSIYRCLEDFKFSEPVTVYYGGMSRRYELLVEMTKDALLDLGVDVDKSFTSFTVSDSFSSSLLNSSSGVFINNEEPFPSNEEIKTASEVIKVLYEGIKGGKTNPVNTLEGIRALVQHYKLSRELAYPMHVLLDAYIKSKDDEIMLIDALVGLYNDAKLKFLESDMYLYNIRTSCMVAPSSLDYKDGQMMFYIKGPGGTMRMEVWR